MAFIFTIAFGLISLTSAHPKSQAQRFLARPEYGTPLPGQKVPGDSPFRHCAGAYTKDVLNVTNIALDPQQPEPFAPFAFLLNGTLSTSLSANSTVLLSYLIYDDPDDDILYTMGPICEVMQDTIEQGCPPQKGDVGVFWTMEVPWFYMPGDVLFWHLEAWTEEKERITCLEGVVEIIAPGEGD